MSKYRQDEDRLNELKTGNHRAWKLFFDENIEAFSLFTMKYGQIDREQAAGIFQEAVIILHRNCTEGKLTAPLRSSLQTYLFAIGKNLCRRGGKAHLQFPENLPELPENPFEAEDDRRHNAALVKSLLGRIGEKCRQFLTLVFLEEMPQPDIMQQMEIPSDEAFRKRKFDCLKKMRTLI
ncbi:MAG: sigma-70 family RNA polymerase sigma factor [Lewinellaceae bacterium]|nr:sigma-70 family RNA polymerase sigma factor [Saprospiraceae bacterium]MCB9336666.1 sigma-70 family RNA polymerase sigma factor [Lewinellaceae bacterium]